MWATGVEKNEKNEKNVAPLNDHPTPHHHPLPVEGRAAAHPPPLRCALGSETAPPCAESATHGHARRSGCVLLRGSGHGLPGVRRAQGGSVPRGGAHSATADGLLLFRPRSRVVVGCGCPRSPHGGAASATPPLGFRTASMRSRAALRIPEGIGARDSPDAAARRLRGLPDPRRSRPPSPGSRNACAGSQPPPAPAQRASRQGSGRVRSHGRSACVSAPAGAPSPLALGRLLIAPARPSPAPRGGARAPAPLPGLR